VAVPLKHLPFLWKIIGFSLKSVNHVNASPFLYRICFMCSYIKPATNIGIIQLFLVDWISIAHGNNFGMGIDPIQKKSLPNESDSYNIDL
jgi:hypothetical protein